MSWLEEIRKCFEANAVWYSRHARVEMINEEFGRIHDEEVYQAISVGEIIEEYLNDSPYPSVLIFGRTKTDRPLHILCAYNKYEDLAVIVTVYQPDPVLWIDFKRRKT